MSADKSSSSTTTVITNPDGSIAVLEEVGKTPAYALPSPAYSPPPQYAPPMQMQAPSRVVVACPRCGQHLMPPPGAPVYACVCGQTMRSPVAVAAPTVVIGGGYTTYGVGGFGLTAPLGYQQGAVLSSPSRAAPPSSSTTTTTTSVTVGGTTVKMISSGAGSGSGAPAPAPAVSRTYSTPRIITCGNCRTMLSTNADVTICGVCNFRNQPAPPPYPGARPSAVLGSVTIITPAPAPPGIAPASSSQQQQQYAYPQPSPQQPAYAGSGAGSATAMGGSNKSV